MTIKKLVHNYAVEVCNKLFEGYSDHVKEEAIIVTEEEYLTIANKVLELIEVKLDELRKEGKSLWTNSYLRDYIKQLKE